MLKKILLLIIATSFIFSFIGKYSATTDGGYYTHYIEFYSNGTYSSTIFGETSYGDWVEDGKYVKLYSYGYNIENIYVSDDKFYFGGITFSKIKTNYNTYSNSKISPIGTWSGMVNSIYGGKSPYKMTFYSDGSYVEKFAGESNWGNWQINSDEIVMTGSTGTPTWSGSIYKDKISLTSTSPYLSSLKIELTKQ